MAPKRKPGTKAKPPTKKAKPDTSAAIEKLLDGGASYCEELSINLKKGGDAPFQWLCCSVIFSIGIAEQSTFRAAKGLLTSGLTDPKSVKEADMREKIDAVNSQGNVQRGPSMSGRLESAADMLLEKYGGDLEKLREAAGRDPEQERKLLKEFKGVGDTAVNIFCREAQLVWEELFPFADERTLETLAHHGISCSSAEEVAKLVNNDRTRYVRLLAQATKEDLRGGKKPGGSSKKASEAEARQLQGKEASGTEGVSKAEADGKGQEQGDKNAAAEAEQEQEKEAGAGHANKGTDEAKPVQEEEAGTGEE